MLKYKSCPKYFQIQGYLGVLSNKFSIQGIYQGVLKPKSRLPQKIEYEIPGLKIPTL